MTIARLLFFYKLAHHPCFSILSYPYIQSFDLFDDLHDQETSYLKLHHYTSIICISLSQNLIDFIRKANISKSYAERLINLIQSALLQPNTLLKNYNDLLKLSSGTIICLSSQVEKYERDPARSLKIPTYSGSGIGSQFPDPVSIYFPTLPDSVSDVRIRLSCPGWFPITDPVIVHG